MEQEQPQPAVLDREALLEEIRAGRMVAIGERTAHDEAGVDFLLSFSAEALAPAPDLASVAEAPLEGTPQHETIILTPGSAVYRADGLLPAVIEGSESAPVWCLPGDFERYLVPGNPGEPTNGIVREVLVGLPRDERDGDLDIADGIFLKPEQWNSVVMPIESALRSLAQQIGIDLESEQLPEQMPRGKSWLAERADADATLRSTIDSFEEQIRDRDKRIGALQDLLSGESATPESQPEPASESQPAPEPEPVVSESSKTKAGK